MLGLKRGCVALAPHEDAWEAEAARTVELLRKLLGASAAGAEHVGSTAVRGIEAKPIIDIAVAARSLEEIKSKAARLGRYGFIFRGEDVPWQLLFVIEDEARGVVTHHIHIVEAGGAAWRDYIGLRDYLNAFPREAERYGALKRELARRFPADRKSYTAGKAALIAELLAEARKWRRGSAAQ